MLKWLVSHRILTNDDKKGNTALAPALGRCGEKTEPGAEAPVSNVRFPQLPLRALFGAPAKPKDPELPLRALLTPPNVLHIRSHSGRTLPIVNANSNEYNTTRSFIAGFYRFLMHSISFLIICSLFSQVNVGNTSSPQGLLPNTRQSGISTSVSPVIPPLVAPQQDQTVQPATESRQYHTSGGMTWLPEFNNVPLAAPERAVLMSLRTEQRDDVGNILRDADGNPIMIPVRKGMRVFKDQVLGIFDDVELHSILKINEAQLELARTEAKKEIELIHAAHGVRLAWLEHQMMIEANQRTPNSFPKIDVERAKFTMEQANAQLELQKFNLHEVKRREVVVRENELERTRVLIDRRKLISSLNGMIIDITAAEGQWLREGEPVLHIVQFDPIWIQIMVPVMGYELNDLYGKQANVRVPLANGRFEMFQGTVVFCKPNIEGGDNFFAYVEIENPRRGHFWLLQPGIGGVEVVIPLQQ